MPSARFNMLDRSATETAKDIATRRVRFRGAGFVPASSRFGGWIALALVIAIWQVAGSAGVVNPLFLPAPSAIARAIYQLAVSGALWQHLSASLLRIGVGWLLGTAAGVAVGFAIGLSRLARSVGITFISALFPIPKVALLLVVSAEMIGAQYGIGAFVLQAGNLMQTDQLLAGVVILSVFGLAVGRVINLLETKLLHWR